MYVNIGEIIRKEIAIKIKILNKIYRRINIKIKNKTIEIKIKRLK